MNISRRRNGREKRDEGRELQKLSEYRISISFELQRIILVLSPPTPTE